MRSALIAVVLAAPSAAGADCGTARPWVKVSFAAEALGTEFADSVLADLGAELARQGIDVCREGEGTPVASIALSATSPASVTVAIDVRDGVTEKRIGRDLDLADIPEDGRSLAIAVAAEEVLTASWAELALAGAPEPPAPPPREVTRTVERALPRHAPSSAAGARFGLERFGGGQTHVGGDAFSRFWVLPRAGGEVALELRDGLATSTAHGEIDARALGGSVGIVVAVLPRERRFGLDGVCGVGVTSVTFEGRPDAGARGDEPTEIVVVGRASVSASLAIAGPVRIEAGGGVGWPIRGFEGTDFGQEATGATGLELHARAGLSVGL